MGYTSQNIPVQELFCFCQFVPGEFWPLPEHSCWHWPFSQQQPGCPGQCSWPEIPPQTWLEHHGPEIQYSIT